MYSVALLLVSTLYFSQALEFKDDDDELRFDRTNRDFKSRDLETAAFSLGPWHGVWYASYEINTTQGFKGDFIVGSIYIGKKTYPVNWQAYYTSSVNANRSLSNVSDWLNYDVTVTSSYIAAAYLSLSEVNVNGTVVEKHSLVSYWKRNDQKGKQLTNVTAGIYAHVFQTQLPNQCQMEILYLLTKEAGVVDIAGGVTVVPKAIETVITITGWDYESPENKLVLDIAAGSTDFTYESDGEIATAADGASRVFFHVEPNALIDGKKTDTSISLKRTKDVETVFSNKEITAQLKSRYEGTADVGIFSVSFAPGAKEIVYDPTVGVGQSPYEPAPSGLSSGAIAAIVICVLVAVGAIVALVQHRRRLEYAQV